MRRGGLAQLGEHLLCKQGVVGSIPSSSTKRAAGWLWLGWSVVDWLVDGLAGCLVDGLLIGCEGLGVNEESSRVLDCSLSLMGLSGITRSLTIWKKHNEVIAGHCPKGWCA